PAAVVGRRYARRAAAVNVRLHDELEREVEGIERAGPAEGRGHYGRVGGWRGRLSDLEAGDVRLVGLVTVVRVTGALLRACLAGGADAARIATVLGYLNVFVTGLVNLPLVLEQWGRLRDIGRRAGGLASAVEGAPHLADEVGAGGPVVAPFL